MAWLYEQRSRRGWSTPTIGTFVADKADTGQEGTVTVASAEGLVRV